MLQLVLTAAAALPVLGIVETTKETLSGSLRGSELLVQFDRGASCVGRVRLGETGWGTGTLSCADGRSGRFVFHLVNGMGTAQGELDGEALTLTFG